MDLKKIGKFLKRLRKEKGITQEQASEIFGVSSRTISRWETGSNMPDLSILIQIADYYDVEIREILEGDRKGENMNSEIKETLLKVADYNELEKEKTLKAGNTSFGLMFIVCVAAIAIQLAITSSIIYVIGETAVMLIGGGIYIAVMVKNGVWETGSKIKSTPKKDALTSILCSGLFSLILVLTLMYKGARLSSLAYIIPLFFVVIAIIGYVILRVLARINKKQKDAINK